MKSSLLLLSLFLLIIPTTTEAARLWSSGCELQSQSPGAITDALEFVELTDATKTLVDTGLMRTGLSSCRADNDPAPGQARFSHRFTASTVSTFLYARSYIYISTMPTTSPASNKNRILWFWDQGIDGQEGGVGLNTNGTLSWFDDDFTETTGTTVLSTGQWYRIEISYDAGAAWEVKIDGTSEISAASNDGDAVDSVAFGICDNGAGNCTGDIYFDDMALNDISGSAQTGYPGAGSIVHMQPDSAGDNNACTPGDYTSVDEITPDDSSTICTLDADADILDVNVESSSSAGIGSSDTITLVQVGARHSGGNTNSYNSRIKSASGGTTSSGTVISVTSATYHTNDDTIGNRNYHLTSYTDPTTAVAWTPTGTNSLDNMQIGATAPDALPDMLISTLWALVEFVPAAAPAGIGEDFGTIF